jgi:nicotinamide-nucleotide adenylyltransferase
MRGLIVGRFQPFHNGHMELIRHIMKTFEPAELIVGIGSAQESYTLRHPFTAGESFEKVSRFVVVPIEDIDRHALWVSHVESLLPDFKQVYTNDPLNKVLFKEAGYEVPDLPKFNRGTYQGTEIRRRMIAGEEWRDLVPLPVFKFLEDIHAEERLRLLSSAPEAVRLQEDKNAIK